MPEDLTADELRLLKLLLCMTGREDRLAREPLVERPQAVAFKAISPLLMQATERGWAASAQCDLLNRLLLSLGIKTVSQVFFDTLFHGANFSNLNEIDARVQDFRTLCMLDYGSFRFGFKKFRDGTEITLRWQKYFPTNDKIQERAQRLNARPELKDIAEIGKGELFSLGYLAGEHAPEITKVRAQLLHIIERGMATGVKDFDGLQDSAKTEGVTDVATLIAKAGIPGAESAVSHDFPLIAKGRSYLEILGDLKVNCIAVDTATIRAAQQRGLQNAHTYMTMHDLDVYVATSMRDPLHFTTNWAFVDQLFRDEQNESAGLTLCGQEESVPCAARIPSRFMP